MSHETDMLDLQQIEQSLISCQCDTLRQVKTQHGHGMVTTYEVDNVSRDRVAQCTLM